MYDNVDKPIHYNTHPSGIEAIEITAYLPFCEGNAFKYLFRCGKKSNLIEDVKKARFYIQHVLKGNFVEIPIRNLPYEFFNKVLQVWKMEDNPYLAEALKSIAMSVWSLSREEDMRSALKIVEAYIQELEGSNV